jgi:hypothetical protein
MDFTDTISTLRTGPRDILVSFDVISLFTMVPLEEALRLLSRHFDEAILRLFRHVLTSSFFSFSGQLYEQTDGVRWVRRSPLSLQTISWNTLKKWLWIRRPISPSAGFATWMTHSSSSSHGPGKLAEFLDHLNGLHENIKFTMETEKDGHLPFLYKPDGSLGNRVYRKPTHTNLYLHANSHHHPSNK